MHKFVRNLLTEWRKLKLPFENETILIGVSGGADSVSLALALNELQNTEKLKLNFVVGHFNHNLRGEKSRRDAEFVEDLTAKLNFEFIGGIQDSNFKLENQKGNLEQLARNARYKFLENTANLINAQRVLTAHTLNDQAETFLLRLIRGSGSDGLGAMRSISEIPNSRFKIQDSRFKIQDSRFKTLLVRPLLSWAKRENTEELCRSKQIDYCLDEMNDDSDFSRVRVRKELFPFLKSFNPKIIEKIANTAFLLQEDANQLNCEAQKLLENAKLENINCLKVKYLIESSKSLRRRTLRLWILENNFNLFKIDSKHIEAIEKVMFSEKSGRIIELSNGINIVKKGGKLFFEKS